MTRIILMVGTILFSLGLFAQTEITDQIVYTCQIKNELSQEWDRNLNDENRALLYNFLIDGIEKGTLTATGLDQSYLPCEDCIMDAGKAMELLSFHQPLNADDQATGNRSEQMIEKKYGPDDFSHLQFIESWEIDEVSGAFKKNVKAVSFLIPNYSKSGELRGHEMPFLIWFGEPSFRD